VSVVELTIPGDKSVTHRALMLAAVADGESRLEGCLVSLDTGSTASCLRALGVPVPDLEGGPLRIRGLGLRGLSDPATALDCGNSGTTARLLLGLLAGAGVRAELTGDASLRDRPMRRVTRPLEAMGARFTELDRSDCLPIRIEAGTSGPIAYDSPQASAQVKSALLFAALTSGVTADVSEAWLSRDHSERMLRAMGARCESFRREDGRAAVRLEPSASLRPLDIRIPGDISSSAFLLARGLLGARTGVRVRGVGINPARTGFLRVVERMGAEVAVENERDVGGEPVADLVARPSALCGTTIGAAEIPGLIDEVPVLAVLAALASGETRIEGAAELRVKESDRLTTLAVNLRAVGAAAEELPDGLVIEGGASRLHGRVATHGDHRIAMAFGVLAGLPGNDIEIDDPAVTAVSFPGFADALATIADAETSP
jgi:3-phosphoshikimate 1-carboxyvinyltransferase